MSGVHDGTEDSAHLPPLTDDNVVQLIEPPTVSEKLARLHLAPLLTQRRRQTARYYFQCYKSFYVNSNIFSTQESPGAST